MTNVNEYGFTLVKVINIKRDNTVNYYFEHNKTKSIVLFSCDKNSITYDFNYMFYAPNEDAFGTRHVLEHIICHGGCNKPYYAFGNLYKYFSLDYINALTGINTMRFIFGTKYIKDFISISEFFMDAIYNPYGLSEIDSMKQTFKNHGDCLEIICKNNTENKKINGIVFNEMLSINTKPNRVISNETLKNIICDGKYTSGGDNRFMHKLKFENVLEYHKTYIHPSNSVLVCNGNFSKSDMYKVLNLVNGFYSNYKHVNFKQIIKNRYLEGPFEYNKTKKIKYYDPNGKNHLVLLYEIDKVKTKDKNYYCILNDIISRNGSGFMKYLMAHKNNLFSSVNLEIDKTLYSKTYIRVDVNDVLKGDDLKEENRIQKEIIKIIKEAYVQSCKEDFADEDIFDACVNNFYNERLDLEEKRMKGKILSECYAFEIADDRRALEKLAECDDEFELSYLKKLAKRNLFENQKCLALWFVSRDSFVDDYTKAIKYARTKMKEDEYNQMLQFDNEYKIDCLKYLEGKYNYKTKTDTLNKEIAKLEKEYFDKKKINKKQSKYKKVNIVSLRRNTFCDEVNFVFNINDLSKKEYQLFNLLNAFVRFIDYTNYSNYDFEKARNRVFLNFRRSLSLNPKEYPFTTNQIEYAVKFRYRTENKEEAFKLINEFFFNMKFEEGNKYKNLFSDVVEQGINTFDKFAFKHPLSYLRTLVNTNDAFGKKSDLGFDSSYFELLKEIKNKMDNSEKYLDELFAEFKNISYKVFNKERVRVVTSGKNYYNDYYNLLEIIDKFKKTDVQDVSNDEIKTTPRVVKGENVTNDTIIIKIPKEYLSGSKEITKSLLAMIDSKITPEVRKCGVYMFRMNVTSDGELRFEFDKCVNYVMVIDSFIRILRNVELQEKEFVRCKYNLILNMYYSSFAEKYKKYMSYYADDLDPDLILKDQLKKLKNVTFKNVQDELDRLKIVFNSKSKYKIYAIVNQK